MIRRSLPWALGLGGVLVLLAFLARRLWHDWQALPPEAFAQFHLDGGRLLAAWAVQTAGWLLLVDTWRRILARLGGEAPFRRHLQLHAYTRLAMVIPGSIWAPMSRVAFYGRLGVPAVSVGAAIVVEWVLLGLAGLSLYALSAPFSVALAPWWAGVATPGSAGGAVGAGGVGGTSGVAATGGMAAVPVPALIALAGVALVAVVLLSPRAFAALLGPLMRRFGRGAGEVPRLEVRMLVDGFARELVVLALAGWGLVLVMMAVSPAASLADAMAAVGLTVAISNLLAWLPATGLVKDAGMVLLLTPLYHSSLIALGVVVAWRIWLVVVELSWAALATVLVLRDGSGPLLGQAPLGPPEESEA